MSIIYFIRSIAEETECELCSVEIKNINVIIVCEYIVLLLRKYKKLYYIYGDLNTNSLEKKSNATYYDEF